MSEEQFEEKFKSLVKHRNKSDVISRALGFLDNGKFNKQVFRNFDKILKEKQEKKGISIVLAFWKGLGYLVFERFSGIWISWSLSLFGIKKIQLRMFDYERALYI